MVPWPSTLVDATAIIQNFISQTEINPTDKVLVILSAKEKKRVHGSLFVDKNSVEFKNFETFVLWQFFDTLMDGCMDAEKHL